MKYDKYKMSYTWLEIMDYFSFSLSILLKILSKYPYLLKLRVYDIRIEGEIESISIFGM